jgi:hypothetical protein
MNRTCLSLALTAILLPAAIAPRHAKAGVVADKGDAYWWVSGLATAAPNNDDFKGQFADNPNKVRVNSAATGGDRVRQRIDAIERIVPTAASTGITEYAMTLGGSQPTSPPEDTYLTALNNKYIIELGFGTGSNFVPAHAVAPLLRFDPSDMVNPAIQNYKPIPIATLPMLELKQHLGDALLLQGRYDLGNFRIGSFSAASMFVLPLDIPDLPSSARAYYSAAELTGLSDTDVPFTLRMHIVPEPTTMALAALAILGTAIVLRWSGEVKERTGIARNMT